MDTETRTILDKNKHLSDLIGSDGWREARAMLSTKILDLQNAFNIDDSDPQKLFLDLQARKIASQVLFDFLREIEGSAAQSNEGVKPKESPLIYRVN